MVPIPFGSDCIGIILFVGPWYPATPISQVDPRPHAQSPFPPSCLLVTFTKIFFPPKNPRQMVPIPFGSSRIGIILFVGPGYPATPISQVDPRAHAHSPSACLGGFLHWDPMQKSG